MVVKYNKLDNPLKSIKELDGEVEWKIYNYKDKFTFLCDVKPNKDKEELVCISEELQDMNRSCVYIMVIAKKIFKIGIALRGMRSRVGSYNTGKTKYRIRGTNSGANYWVLQSLINMDQEASVYALYPEIKKCNVFGEDVDEPFPSAKTIEGIIIKRFEKEYGKKPIGCTQK